MNIDKSGIMAIGSNRRLPDQQIEVKIDDVSLKQETVVKLLGVSIDPNLKWETHINSIIAKLAPKIGLLSRLRQTLSHHLLDTVYKSIIQPHFDYCDTVWGNCKKQHQDLLQRLQNRAARIVTCVFDSHVLI